MQTKAVYDVLAEGASMDSIVAALSSLDIGSKLDAFLPATHRIRSVYFGAKCSQKEQIKNIKLLEKPFLSRLNGSISLSEPQCEYHIVADFGDQLNAKSK